MSQALRDARIHIDLQLGCEYTYGEQFHGEISEQTARTIGNSNYVLLELPERTMPHAVPQALFQVSLAGYYPILAHPERCRPFQSNGEALSQLANGRALIQVSFRSLAGTFGRSIRKTAWRLVEEGTADLVATDCHSPREIKKIVTPVMKSLKNTLEPSHLDSLMGHYPRSMISGDKGEAWVDSQLCALNFRGTLVSMASIRRKNWTEFWAHLENVDISGVLGYLALFGLAHGLRIYRWSILVSGLGRVEPPSFRLALSATWQLWCYRSELEISATLFDPRSEWD